MKRSVKSAQRKMRVLSFIANAAGTALTGPDAAQVTMADTNTGVKTITCNEPFADSGSYTVHVTTATADSHAEISITDLDTFVVNTFDATDGTTPKDAICHILVIGTDVTDSY